MLGGKKSWLALAIKWCGMHSTPVRSVAANVCGVQANVLAQGNIAEPVDCTAATTLDLPIVFRPTG